MMSEAGSDVTPPEMTSRPPPPLQREQRRAADIVRLLGMYRPLLDACFIDFFSRGLWAQLPPAWQEALAAAPPRQLAAALLGAGGGPEGVPGGSPGGGGPWPLSLLAFVAAARALALPRGRPGGGAPRPPCHSPRLHPLLRRHVKAKKQHEIRRLGKVLQRLSEATGCDRVVDVGSGQGHLSRFLAFGLGLSVTAVEGDGRLAALAERFDRELLRELAKKRARGAGGGSLPPPHHPKSTPRNPKPPPGSPPKKNPAPLWPRCPRHVAGRLDPGAPGEEFLLPPTPGQGPPVRNPLRGEPGGGQRVLLTGLHACGDLSVALLRHFARSPHVAAVTSAACCYMKLSTRPQPQNLGSQPQNPGSQPPNPAPLPQNLGLQPQNPAPLPQNLGPQPQDPSPQPQNLDSQSQITSPQPQNLGSQPQNPALHLPDPSPQPQNLGSQPQNPTPLPQNLIPQPQDSCPQPQNLGLQPQDLIPQPQKSGPRSQISSPQPLNLGPQPQSPNFQPPAPASQPQNLGPQPQNLGLQPQNPNCQNPAPAPHPQNPTPQPPNLAPHPQNLGPQPQNPNSQPQNPTPQPTNLGPQPPNFGPQLPNLGPHPQNLGSQPQNPNSQPQNPPPEPQNPPPQPQNPPPPPVGYPLSSWVSGLRGHELSFRAREAACHALEAFAGQLQGGGSSQLRPPGHGAAPQSPGPTASPQHPRVRPGRTALSLGGPDSARQQELLAFRCLALLLAPLVESLILLDRLLYLREQGFQCALLPLFDPRFSPRNLVLVAARAPLEGVLGGLGDSSEEEEGEEEEEEEEEEGGEEGAWPPNLGSKKYSKKQNIDTKNAAKP
ncbi:methyltransferase-like protein 25B isoform X2 [Anas acuta]